MKPVKLGNEKALQITNNLHIRELNNKITTNYNIDIEYKRYHFLDKTRAAELKQKEHSFVLNTYGAKYLLFLTKVNFKPYALYINRKNGTFFLIKTRFSKELYEDTILEGESIKINEKWCFYVSDCLVYRRESILLKPYSERCKILANLLENEYVEDSYMEPFRLVQKRRFEFQDIRGVYSYIESLPFRVNGYVFKCENNASYDLLYIFPECRNKKKTVDGKKEECQQEDKKMDGTLGDKTEATFLVKNTEFPDVYEIYMFDKIRGNTAKIGYAGIPSIDCSIMVKKWFAENDSVYAKFKKNPINDKWIPISLTK